MSRAFTNVTQSIRTLHFFHVHSIFAALTLHHGFHHLLHTAATPHLALHLLEHTRWHGALIGVSKSVHDISTSEPKSDAHLHRLDLRRRGHTVGTLSSSTRGSLHLLHR